MIKKIKIHIKWTLIAVIIIMAGFFLPSARAENPAVRVFVSILPQQYLVTRIGGERVRVSVLVQPGESPATYHPTPKQIATLLRSNLFFRVGVPFEDALLPRLEQMIREAGNGAPRIINMAEGITLKPVRRYTESNTPAVLSPGETPDPHTWLSPPLLKIQAHNVVIALEAVDPAGRDFYEKRYQQTITELDALDRELHKMLAPCQGKAFLAFHPAYGYFADTYGLRQEVIEIEGKTPSPRQLRRIIGKARAGHIRVVFVQPQFDQHSAERVALGIGGIVETLDPLAADIPANLRHIAAVLRKALCEN